MTVTWSFDSAETRDKRFYCLICAQFELETFLRGASWQKGAKARSGARAEGGQLELPENFKTFLCILSQACNQEHKVSPFYFVQVVRWAWDVIMSLRQWETPLLTKCWREVKMFPKH